MAKKKRTRKADGGRDRVTGQRMDGGTALRIHEPIAMDRDELARRAAGARVDLQGATAKAHVVGEARQAPLSEEPAPDPDRVFQKEGAIEPPFDPRSLVEIFEASAWLRPNVDSYATNVEAFGHRFEPTIDLESTQAHAMVKDAMAMLRLSELEAAGKKGPPKEPTDKEVQAKIDELRRRQRWEKFKLESLFNFINPTLSFPEIRKRTRTDLEVMGNGYWEVLRSRDGEIAQVEQAVAPSMRMLDKDPDWIDVEMNHRTSPISMGKKKVKRRFRRFIQLQGEVPQTRVVWFKEFGDPRTMSAGSGKFYESKDQLLVEEGPDARPATEVVHFKIYSSRTAYGIPRWIGALISVLGSRHSEEVNFLYFENKSVPPLALLVSGGKVAKTSVNRIRDFIQNELRGKRNFHKVLVIEAEARPGPPGTTPSQQPRLELKPLTDAQQQDALFQEYDKRNGQKVGAAFRVPPILRGETLDFNRATAVAAKAFAEEQVFEPERNDFDFLMNRLFLSEMGILMLRFRSLAPIKRDPAVMAQILERLSKIGVVNPAEGRIVAGDILNMDLDEIKVPWTQQPLQLTLAGFAPGQVPGITAPATGTMQAAAPSAAAKQDLTTAELAALGGLKLPAQGIPKELHEKQVRELRRRLRALQRLGLFQDLDQLFKLADSLSPTRDAGALPAGKAGGNGRPDGGTAPGEVLTIRVPSEEWQKWWEEIEPLEGEEPAEGAPDADAVKAGGTPTGESGPDGA